MISSGGGNLRSFTRRSTVRVLIPSRLATSALVNRSRGRPSTAVSSASSRKRMVSRRSLLMLVVQVMFGQTLTSFGQGSQRAGGTTSTDRANFIFAAAGRGRSSWPARRASCPFRSEERRAASSRRFFAASARSRCSWPWGDHDSIRRLRPRPRLATAPPGGACWPRPSDRPQAAVSRTRPRYPATRTGPVSPALADSLAGTSPRPARAGRAVPRPRRPAAAILARSPTPRTRVRSLAPPRVRTANRHDGGSRRPHNFLDHPRQRLEGVALLGFICVPVIDTAHPDHCVTETPFGDIAGHAGAAQQCPSGPSQVMDYPAANAAGRVECRLAGGVVAQRRSAVGAEDVVPAGQHRHRGDNLLRCRAQRNQLGTFGFVARGGNQPALAIGGQLTAPQTAALAPSRGRQ